MQGCGKGYDVVMLALHGFDVVGLEISQKGVSTAEEYASSELQSPQPYNFGAVGACTRESGSISLIQGDFFHPDATSGEKFDVIYDYTVRYGMFFVVFPAVLMSPVSLCSSSNHACSMGLTYG